MNRTEGMEDKIFVYEDSIEQFGTFCVGLVSFR